MRFGFILVPALAHGFAFGRLYVGLEVCACVCVCKWALHRLCFSGLLFCPLLLNLTIAHFLPCPSAAILTEIGIIFP